MAQTQKKSSPVLFAVVFVFLASVAFGVAMYFFDGAGAAEDLIALVGLTLPLGDAEETPASEEPTSTPSGLSLPSGVSEEFALRVWQEQVDSQANIRRLMDGEMVELSFSETSVAGYEGKTRVTAKFKDGSSAPGALHMAKLGENWYFEYITGLRSADLGDMSSSTQRSDDVYPDTPLPDVDDVDTGVLNTIFAEQAESQDVFKDYLEGNVRKVVVDKVERGPGTATVSATMIEKDHTVRAQIVLIRSTIGGRELWFLTKFAKTDTVS